MQLQIQLMVVQIVALENGQEQDLRQAVKIKSVQPANIQQRVLLPRILMDVLTVC